MLLPTVLGTGFWDDWEKDLNDKKVDVMRTDVRDCGDHYKFVTDLPGFRKEDIKAKLEKGILTISATRNDQHEEKDEHGRYVRRERYIGSCSRSFYVGDELVQDDIKAKFSEGVLTLEIPKEPVRPEPEDTYISID